ncbi:MAG TPA: nicotinate phosphoribosyltransferase, partial [Sutterella sp.]|nr:nicotinate phosphoribosyltransferase [Sutterella sp.]
MIIESLLDTDLYKFTMMQCVLHQFPSAHVEYRFKCRTPGVSLVPYVDAIREEVAHLCSLRFTDDELAYLKSLRFIKPDFVDFLSLFHLKEKYVDIQTQGEELQISIKGPWLHTIMFEIPILAIVNETYFANRYPDLDWAEGRKRLKAKIDLMKSLPDNHLLAISDFGTRRRFSRVWQREVLETLIR